jgi:pimeloyl-ACP methyl ester carboxylesterase
MKSISSLGVSRLNKIRTEAQITKSFVTSDGETLFYTTKGHGPKVVLLYGGPGIGAGPMRLWADSLSNKYECITFDQRGTGLSFNVKLDSDRINLSKGVQDLDELRIHLGEQQLTLCGICWGGGLAQSYASFYPENTKNIVLVCSIGPDLSFLSAYNCNMYMRRLPNERDSLRYWNNQPTTEFSKMMRRFFWILPAFYDHNLGYKMLPEFFAAATFHDRQSEFMWLDLKSTYDLKLKLMEYRGECTIVKTSYDAMPEETGHLIKNLLPQAEIRTIEKCGHFPDYEKPKQLFSILHEVL